jgi:hypothetical protein
MFHTLAISILNLYPHAISQFGLIGCAVVTVFPIITLWILYKLICRFVFTGRRFEDYRWYN